MRTIALLLLGAALWGCGSNAAPTTTPVAQASAAPCPEVPAAQVAHSDTPDPDVVQLAAAAKNCKFESGRFDWECPAFKEWARENEDLFEGPGGNATILSMLEDPDIRLRTLAAERGFQSGRTFFAERKRAERLLAVVEKERDTRLLRSYGRFVGHLNAEKLGMKTELRAYLRHPSLEFRDALAEYALPQNPTAFSLELAKEFMRDPDRTVQRSALRSLSSHGRTRPTKEICEHLRAQLGRADGLAEDALEAGATSKCDGMAVETIAEIEKRAANLEKLVGRDGLDVRNALSSLCWRSTTPKDVHKRAFDVAAKVAPKLEDPWRKRSFLWLFRSCDASRAKEALTPFLKDKEKEVAEEAKSEIKRTEEELARN